MAWKVDAPNVVTEARFRELVRSGWSAEILCQESAFRKGPSYYGRWVMRARSADNKEKFLVTARTSSGTSDISIREFKTVTGVVSFLLGLGFAHADIPLVEGAEVSLYLPPPADRNND